MRIRYLSFGSSKTGGYRHEKTLFDAACAYYAAKGPAEGQALRKNRQYSNPLQWLSLLLWSYRNAAADLNIVTARSAIPAMLRNARNKSKVWIVLHNYDEQDGKSRFLALYYRLLFRMLRKAGHGRFRVIAVAPYWLRYFKETLQLPEVNLFPNLFDNALYRTYAEGAQKNAWVHLGQFSSKNDPGIFELAVQLSRQGYYCYFSTLDPAEARQGSGQFDILYFMDFKDYLEQMSRSCCTLALPQINEGWNRIAHESMLCGTPVIGYAKGGLGDLLRESCSVVVKNPEEAYTCITQSLWVLPSESFFEHYDVAQAAYYIQDLCRN